MQGDRDLNGGRADGDNQTPMASVPARFEAFFNVPEPTQHLRRGHKVSEFQITSRSETILRRP